MSGFKVIQKNKAELVGKPVRTRLPRLAAASFCSRPPGGMAAERRLPPRSRAWTARATSRPPSRRRAS